MASLVYIKGVQPSISIYSNYIETAYIFKIWMIILAIGASKNKMVRWAVYPCLGMAIFDSLTTDPIINVFHDIAAVGFFGSVTIQFLHRKFTRVTGILLLLSFFVYPFSGLFWGESLSILILYGHFLYKLYKLNTNQIKLKL
jgi:hypothetical protein